MAKHQKRMGVLLTIFGLIVACAMFVSAQTAVTKQQGASVQNVSTTSAADTAITTSIAAVSGERVHLHGVSAYCSAGTSTLTVKNGVGGTTIFKTPAAFIGTTVTGLAWTTPLDSSTGSGMDIVLGTCGGGNTGTLNVQADRY